MKTEYTDEQLQLALARELPELIEVQKNTVTSFYWKADKMVLRSITPREWPWIVGEVEKKLDEIERQNTYQSFIAQILWEDESRAHHQVVFNKLTAPWQTRAIAYFKTIGKEIV